MEIERFSRQRQWRCKKETAAVTADESDDDRLTKSLCKLETLVNGYATVSSRTNHAHDGDVWEHDNAQRERMLSQFGHVFLSVERKRMAAADLECSDAPGLKIRRLLDAF